jgi:hypothetical protein
MRSSLKILAAIAVAATALSTAPASAHAPRDPSTTNNIAKLAAAAQLAFRGKVTRVVYRQSKTATGEPGLPYTFVTYAVSRVLQGSAGRTITLRFPGGSDGRGGFVDVTGVPTFEVGDDDILFVTGNGDAGCPLVECEFGRFRVLDGAVHEAHGTPVRKVSGGKLTFGGTVPEAFKRFSFPAPSFEALAKRPEVRAAIREAGMTMAQARARYAAEAPKRITVEVRDPLVLDGAASGSDATPARALGVESFLSAVDASLQLLPARPLSVISSADPGSDLVSPAVRATAPVMPKGTAAVQSVPEAPVRKD